MGKVQLTQQEVGSRHTLDKHHNTFTYTYNKNLDLLMKNSSIPQSDQQQ